MTEVRLTLDEVNAERAARGWKPICQEDWDAANRNAEAIKVAAARPACACGCCVRPDFGACDTFLAGMNGRCVHCDHKLACHARDKHNATFNIPIGFCWR